jgi:hypothetical protein
LREIVAERRSKGLKNRKGYVADCNVAQNASGGKRSRKMSLNANTLTTKDRPPSTEAGPLSRRMLNLRLQVVGLCPRMMRQKLFFLATPLAPGCGMLPWSEVVMHLLKVSTSLATSMTALSQSSS